MTNFATQLKDKFLGLVDRVTSCGGRRAVGGDKDLPEATNKLPEVQVSDRPRIIAVFSYSEP